MKDVFKGCWEIIAGLFILILISCSSENMQTKEVFVSEKMFFEAEKIKQNILTNPDIASPEQYEKVEQAYRAIIDQFGSKITDSPQIQGVVRRSWLTLAQLSLLQKKIENAIQVYQEIIDKVNNDRELCAVAQFSLAEAFERTDRFDEAIDSYQRVIRDYPPVMSDTLLPNFRILQTPIYIARLYRVKGRNDLAEQQYVQARQYYEGVTKKYPGTEIAMAAHNQIAMTYSDQGNWQQAIAVLNDIIRQYPEQPNLIGIKFSLASIYDQQLRQSDRALDIYWEIIQQYPADPSLGKVYLAMGNVYFKQNRYTEARDCFSKVLQNYRNDGDAAINAQTAIAKSYENEGNWTKALNEYQWIVENYPKSMQALNIPLYIADYYIKTDQQDLARTAFENAVRHYQQIADQYPNTMLAAVALDYSVPGYANIEDWDGAARTLRKLADMDIPAQNKIKTYLTLENIYEEKLKDTKKALAVYSEMLEKYPQLPFAADLKTKSQKLQQQLETYNQTNTPPMASDIIDAKGYSPTSIEISWQRNHEDDFSHYQLIRSETPGVELSDMKVAEISLRNQSTFLDENLKQGNTYYYRLFTFDKGGLNAASQEVSVKAEAKQIAASVTLQAHANVWSEASLNWNSYQENDFDSYKIYRSSSPGVSLSSQLVKSIYDQATTQFTDVALNENSTYYYKLYVYNRDGANKPSNEVKITTASNQPPGAILLNKPLKLDQSSVELSWSASHDPDFSMYRIYRSEQTPVSVAAPPIWMNSNQSINQYKDMSLKTGKTYYYKIVVYDKGGLFAESNEVVVRN